MTRLPARLPRIAYLTPNAILPANRGGRLRAHHLWRAMSAYAEVIPVMIGDTPPYEQRQASRMSHASFLPRRRRPPADLALRGLWEMADPASLPDAAWDALAPGLGQAEALVQHCLDGGRVERLLRLLRRIRVDLVVLCDSSMGVLAPYIKAAGHKLVVGPHNHDSSLYATLAAAAPDAHLRRWNGAASAAFRAAEALFAPSVDRLWVCSEADAGRFAADGMDRSRIDIIPNVYDVGDISPVPQDSIDLVFVGQTTYFPNQDAVLRLFDISRALDRRGTSHRLRIVGRIDPRLRRAAADLPSVQILGEVAEVRPFVEAAALVPIALALGGGTRLKILEAMALGRPVLSSSIGIEGIDATSGIHAVIEDDFSKFPDRIGELLQDRGRAQRIASAGWDLVRSRYSHATLRRLVGESLRQLGLNDTAAPASLQVGLRVMREQAHFNPWSRLLSWTIDVRSPAPQEAIAAAIETADRLPLMNAFVTIKRRPHGLVGLEAAAVLPAGVNPGTLSIEIRLWGDVVARRPIGPIETEAAGLLSLNVVGGMAYARGWVEGAAPRLSPPPAALSALSPTSLGAINLVRARYDAPPPVIGIAGGNGQGPSFHDVQSWLGPHQPSSSRLHSLRNRHAGEVAWLIGNGPSARPQDLDRLAGRLTFGFNRFYLAHGLTRLRPTYTLTGDQQMIDDFGQQIVDASGGTVFIAQARAPDLVGPFIWLRQMPVFPPMFSQAPDLAVSPGGSTPFVAMQLAYYMGVRKFYFYGADFAFNVINRTGAADQFRSVQGDGNHFIPNYRGGNAWCPPSLRDIASAFLTARLVMEDEGGFIRNVTHGGLLEIFEREDFETAVTREEGQGSALDPLGPYGPRPH